MYNGNLWGNPRWINWITGFRTGITSYSAGQKYLPPW